MAIDTLKSITRDGVALRYLDTGAGDPAIVFVHGWCCDHTYWRDQAPAFAANHRIIALDLPGHGSSDKPDRDYSIDGFVVDVASLINELGLDRPIVVGHSMGGVIALNLARTKPDVVSAIVMVDAPIAPQTENLNPFIEQLLAGLRSPAYAGIAAGFVRMQLFNQESPPTLVEEIVAGMSTAPQRVMHTAFASTLAPESRSPGPIPVPSLYVRAATNLATEDQLRERYPGLAVQTVESAHFVQLEKPDETNTLITQFLERVQ